MRRQRADWMRPIDDELLETLADEGNLSPAACEHLDITSKSYASDRLSKLTRYGLVERVTHGLYRLTDAGRDFLMGDLDAATLDEQPGEGED